jgi:hypothetical protein
MQSINIIFFQFFTENGVSCFGEVLYYFRCKRQDTVLTLAVLSVYSNPDPELLTVSHGTLISCNYLGDRSLQVIDVYRIQSVVSMVPHKLERHRVEDHYHFLVERPGLDVVRLGGENNYVSLIT